MMDGLCTNELQQKITSLRRAPPPKPPVADKDVKQNDAELFRLKLKPTVRPVENNTNGDTNKVNNECGDSVANNNDKTKTRSSSIKQLSQAFENGSPGKPVIPAVKPTVAGKKPPVLGAKPTVSSKPQVSPNKHARQSVLIKPDPRIVDGNKETKIPDIAPLPPLSSLGDPPQKPPKFGQLKPSLNKYLGTSYPARPFPVVSEKCSEEKRTSVVIEKTPPPVQDAPPIPKKPTRPDSLNKENKDADKVDEIESEDFYDDTAFPSGPPDEIYDDTVPVNSPEPQDDFYDDTGFTDINQASDETFGEDIYEPIQEQEKQQKIAPPSLPAKDGKEEKKKKEKERKKKEKEEKEEKEREEKERKKKEKEKEKKIHDMKKRFSVKGTEKSLGTCRAAEDIPGNKMDIAASIGEEFDIIRKGKPIPDNKWLVKNKQGLYGFIDINKIEREADEDAEDLYEEVPASKIHSSQSSNGNNISTPPVSSPPPPPSQSAPRPPTGNQDIYDDVAAEQPDEELYEFLPE